jgi:3-dehydroquinate dehydratase/shikimate dehydrogenase
MPGGVDNICVVIGRTRHKMIQVEIVEAAKRGARMIELRLDFLAKAPDFKRLLAEKPCQVVATVRRQQDGGRWNGTEAQRRILLRQAIVAGFDWVDLETDAADEIRRFKDVRRIVSYHNLREVPPDLEAIYERMCRQDPDVVKIAVSAQQPADNLRVLDLLKSPPKPTVAFCLGDMGFPSRILAGKFGAPFAYAAFNKERTIALGIPSFEEMLHVYRYHRLGADTEVFGVIGDPVAHSLSPMIHNTALHQVGYNGVYLPFRVPRGDLKTFLQQYDRFHIRGYSVTIPHKEAALAVAKHSQETAHRVGAANTLVRDSDGFSAFNTDYQAARDSLLAHLAPSPSQGLSTLHERSVLLLGAGGIARAIAHMLQREGAMVTIANRSPERARELAQEVGCRFIGWETRHTVLCELLVNCTPIGMQPNVDECPVHPSILKPEMMVFDTIYSPETTLLIKEARARGCRVLTGVDMFVRQAELQFHLFTHREPPKDLMRTVVKRALSPVALRDDEAGNS